LFLVSFLVFDVVDIVWFVTFAAQFGTSSNPILFLIERRGGGHLPTSQALAAVDGGLAGQWHPCPSVTPVRAPFAAVIVRL
jgi:hypothetical protein